ncbi:MAG TPA: DNA-formamidopyrimidine glycosylase family protein [Planctomycetota bacterium]|nr:DNA-formamidopyrimidine glycosylase family protein [Planctomycetota bacterium]
MPELPDITVYVDRLQTLLAGRPLERVRLANPFLLRSVDPPLPTAQGRAVTGVRRLGKRIVFELEGDLRLVLHLMIAGRLHWRPRAAAIPARIGAAAFDFPHGTLLMTEAGTKKRASLHLVKGADALRAHDPGGLEVADADVDSFRAALTREVHTLKRALTDPRLFSGIGNAYSDEILHRARLSPLRRSDRLTPEEVTRLFDATRAVLKEWTDRLMAEPGFPEKVTAFREGMAVHGRYRKHCPVCGSAVQRIVHADNETNYCATCQTEGRLLADRSLSRLLKDDWPRNLDDLDEKHR